MMTTIWLSLRPDQVEALIAYHKDGAMHAGSLPERADHFRDADDLQRRLDAHTKQTNEAKT